MKKIAIGSDHRGYEIKRYLVSLDHIGDHKISWIDVGTSHNERTDYPQYAEKVVRFVQKHDVDCGILLCGTGIGMSIAANRFKGIFAALVWNEEVARRSKREDGSNVLVLPADYLDNEQALILVLAWLDSEFLGGHYAERLRQVESF
ncbi:TPA: ribose-5-phosphate isomerase [Candidatus Dependentiae bacterium]|nr:MAG: Ribose 5-phosphate isomerase B [candidate division TM6 bacterium GW2011_GWF2_36_131]KKQ03227.1 MAG: Ribose 5-phosphate isomerase B [candidate division TM6 bacterium GW2011_GWE2_36_25]KKQ19818.1 MAG: Ribose 5-phosphate isomerase B [candidate division TM6 bacterium GW2011_GWA2_36_9]HBR70343.1 ribose-5-phosphate isomerase [Candidatus Dependentiae bacterium]HCU00888.1 ribose-5-phosphate isomerase [Candidatus Dependentiae bacterium]